MALFGNKDRANNAPAWAIAHDKLAPTATNRDAMYSNGSLQNITPVEIKSSNGGVAGITLTSNGYNYQATPTVAIANTYGDGAVVGAITMQLVDAQVAHGGNNYAPGDVLAITSTGATSSQAAVINVATTEIRSATVSQLGSGYTNGDIIAVTGGTGTPATFTVTTGTSNTSVASVVVAGAGTYTANPTTSNVATSNTTGSGTGARLNLTTKVKALNLQTKGIYTVLPTTLANNVTSNTTGVGVSCNLNLYFGILSIPVTNAGSYSQAPSVTITGNTDGSNAATATASYSSGGAGKGIAHTGWNLKIVGTGGRNGRVFYETLVAGSAE